MKRSKRTNSSARRQTLEELRTLQRLVAGAVMRPLTARRRMDARAAGAARAIKANARLTGFERLEIYNRQYWFRVLECLDEDYPGLRGLLGEGRFRRLAIDYLAARPSESFTLRNLGRRLAAFMEKRGMPRAAVEMARLEWAHIEAFDNEALAPVSPGPLRGRAPGKIRLRLQPHLTLLRLGYALDEYLLALRRKTGLRGEASNAAEESLPHHAARRVRPRREEVRLAVHRHRNMVYYKRLAPAQFDWVAALQRGRSLESALRRAARTDAAAPVQKWFHDWAALGWLCPR